MLHNGRERERSSFFPQIHCKGSERKSKIVRINGIKEGIRARREENKLLFLLFFLFRRVKCVLVES